MKITQFPNKVLTTPSVDVQLPLSDKVVHHIKNMIKYIDNSQKDDFEDRAGVGLAAPQIGLNLRMFYVNIPIENERKNYIEFLINPKIIGKSIAKCAINSGEGCLSINENKFKTDGYVKRHFKIVMTGYSYFQKKEITITKVGYEAIVLQHEYDHINGKLFIDHINKKNPWTKSSDLIMI